MKYIFTLVSIISIILIIGCYSPTNVNVDVTTQIIQDPSCNCARKINSADGSYTVTPSSTLRISIIPELSHFVVTISGGMPPFVLWQQTANGDTTLRNPYTSGESVNESAGTYVVYVTDSKGERSNTGTVTLSQ